MAYQRNAQGGGDAPALAGKSTLPRGPPPALNPENPALTQPFKDFVLKGFIQKISIEFTPMGTTVFCFPRADLLGEGEDKATKIALGDAKERIIKKELWAPGKGAQGSKAKESGNAAPKKTLRKEDFSLDDSKLLARAKAVAEALGSSTARGRIGSLNLMAEGCDTFEKWWSNATPSEMTRLLVDQKHYKTLAEGEMIRLGRLIRGQCLFQGPVPTPPEEEVEETEKPRPSSSQALVPKKKGGNGKN